MRFNSFPKIQILFHILLPNFQSLGHRIFAKKYFSGAAEFQEMAMMKEPEREKHRRFLKKSSMNE